MQGVVQSYDPATETGIVLAEPTLTPVELRPGSLTGSVFRSLHTGQRIVFEVEQEDSRVFAAGVRVGSGEY